jgi:hypothetical protein
MMWADFVDVMNFIFIANDMWMMWSVLIILLTAIIEELYKQSDKIQTRVDGMLHNEVNIAALEKAVDKLQKDVEKLKDKQRAFANGNGND